MCFVFTDKRAMGNLLPSYLPIHDFEELVGLIGEEKTIYVNK